MSRAGTSRTVVLPAKRECLHEIRTTRWPETVRCPNCNGVDLIKKGRSRKGAQRYQCQDCERVFTDITGTFFAGRQLSIAELCYIVDRVGTATTTEIARPLDRTYKTVLNVVHDVQNRTEGERPDVSDLL
ncbi:IS1 family transposase [Halodesulfurarchaeum sp. HSR-GB]|uniref:IS1/IS1595 family N-terminal zinc-binding domain-containing protein n=1 Tax=Halodesulfurarchaeum sp. HSR-GB TaxID=3074077 RepID=UPI00285BCCC9|nr:IS1 family transposase [Halodesulfurarchaeum sp. HSR-GB]MDR5655798.1 IS1 family transposase [Halodesulfurarchaeum sp. HSR-GB]